VGGRDVVESDVAGSRVSIRAHYERFPATVKGAFVMRGADRNPHQVVIHEARVTEIGSRRGTPIGIETVTLDVAPNLDLFVPFEFPVLDLEAGWYALECDVQIDGDEESVRPGRRFAVPWPRASVRRGSVPVDTVVGPPDDPVRLEALECRGDCVELTYEADRQPDIALSVDGAELAVVEHLFDEGGSGKVIAYPALKSHRRLSLRVGDAEPMDIVLP
jgi:hypothetical protein